MMNRCYNFFCLIIPLLVATSACTGLKYATNENPLFTGHKIKVIDNGHEEKAKLPDMNSVLLPKPNNKFLWMRPALARYNMLSDSAKTKKFWKNKVSESVNVSNVNPMQVARALNNRMHNGGYFQSNILFDTLRTGKKKAKIVYYISPKNAYTYGRIGYPEPIDDISRMISSSSEESFLKTGEIYSLQTLTEERKRISTFLEENGYIYFNPEFLIFRADSVSTKKVIDLEVIIKPGTPPESLRLYKIGKIFIHDDFTPEGADIDTIDFAPYYLITQKNNLKFGALERGIFMEPGRTYSRTQHLRTIGYLSNLPIIRYASLKFSEGDTSDILDPNIYLTQRKRFAYTAEVNTIFRSTNYFGPGVIFTFSDRNTNRGSELLKLNLTGRFEVQVSKGVVNPAYELGVELNYTLPRLYPGFLENKNKLLKTNIVVGYNLFNRLDLYSLNSIYTDIGYKWSRNSTINHYMNPLEIVFTTIPEESKSDEFRDYLMNNPGVQRSFDEQLIVGLGYGLTFDPQSKGKSQFYFRGSIDLAGNILNAISKASNSETDSAGRYTLFGVPFSQYARISTDFRYSYSLSQNSSIATRFIAGVGIPYGNSDILPYIKQFYVGGTNSLRSFIARSVGPGAEVPPEGFNDLTGDIRLEWNLEYRFTISGSFKGALFLDAGNIWLYNEDPSRPDGNFQFDTFLNEIAVSSGFGTRWDFDFVIARLDFAYTLRSPYLSEGERWATGINIWNPVINIAIGYPF